MSTIEYDIVGDVHDRADLLHDLLRLFGYDRKLGIWQHAEQRKAIFVGDMIHGGGQTQQTIDTIRGMVDSGNAFAILGNHEINVLHHYRRDPQDKPLRELSPRQWLSHEDTYVNFVLRHPEKWNQILDWFETLPLWLDFGVLRVVHACWHEASMRKLRANRMTQELLCLTAHESSQRSALANITKGPTIPSLSEEDERPQRLAWWLPAKQGIRFLNVSLEHLADLVGDSILSQEELSYTYESDEPLLFVGHYNHLQHPQAAILAHNIVCVDHGVKTLGTLCAYRWRIGQQVSPDHFCAVG